MLNRRAVASMLALGIVVTGSTGAVGQVYPSKSIRIVTSNPGGTNDFVARLIAQGLTGSLGQQVIVDNRGGGSFISAEVVAKAPPDGYTLLSTDASGWISPLITKTAYDALRDFSSLTLMAQAPLFLVVHPALPVRSVKDLVALAKSRPGELNSASGGVGGSPHLSAELFKSMTGVNAAHIIYKGSAMAVLGLLRGEAHMTIDTGASLMALIQAGKLRALAVTSLKPSAQFPELPTVAATVPGYETRALVVMFVPSGTAAEIQAQLNQELVRLLHQPEVKKRFSDVGLETVGSSQEEVAATVKSELIKFGKVIKDAGIRLQ